MSKRKDGYGVAIKSIEIGVMSPRIKTFHSKSQIFFHSYLFSLNMHVEGTVECAQRFWQTLLASYVPKKSRNFRENFQGTMMFAP